MNEILKTIPTDEVNLLHAKLCRAVGDPKRLQILYALAQSPLTVSELVELTDAPQPTVSRHLAVLRESGVVQTSRTGNSISYSLTVPQIVDVIDSMRSILRQVLAQQVNSLEDAGVVE